jgi:O-antigen ligase
VALFIGIHLWGREKIYHAPFPGAYLPLFIIASFVWAFAALVTAIDVSYSFNEIATKMSKQYLLYFMTFFFVRDMAPGKITWILLGCVLSAFVMSVFACYQFSLSPQFFTNRVHGFTGAFYRLSTFLVFAIPIAIALTLSSRGWMKRILFLSIPPLFAAVFFTFTRGAWIAVAVEVLLLIFIFMKRFRMFLSSLFIAVTLIIGGLAYRSILPTQVILHGSEQPRIEAIKLSSEIMQRYPLTGIGYGKETFSKYYPDTYVKHSHNIFVNTAVETGIVGLFLLIGIVWLTGRTFLRAIRLEMVPIRKYILSGLCASCAGFLTINMFDYMYHGWPGQMCWMLIGISHALIAPGFRQGTELSSNDTGGQSQESV